jgi:hypothetical protein
MARRGRAPRGGGDFDEGSPEEPLRKKPGTKFIVNVQLLYSLLYTRANNKQLFYFTYLEWLKIETKWGSEYVSDKSGF